MRVDTVEGRIVALAARQHGVVALALVTAAGASPNLAVHRVRSGQWRRPLRGVFVVGGAPPTFEQEAMAAVLAAGRGSVASHRTAAWLLGIVPKAPDAVEISVPYPRANRLPGVVVHRSTDLGLARITRRDGIPVTTAGRTLLDLGAVAPEVVRDATWAALRERRTAWDVLLRVLIAHGCRGRAGIGPLRDVVAEHYGEAATDSRTEDKAYRILCDSRRVPLPTKQVPIVCADGVEVTVDFGWEEQRALLEVFGGHHFADEDLWHTDLHRRNQIELAGYRLLIYSGRLLGRQPERFVLDVETLLANPHR